MTPITHIRIEYADGSIDEIEALPDSNTAIPLYGWTRTRPSYHRPSGAYTTPAIAALLFKTVLTRRLTNYDSVFDPKIRELLRNYSNS